MGRHTIMLNPLAESILRRFKGRTWGWLSRYVSVKLIQDFSGDPAHAKIMYLKELLGQKKREADVIKLECKVIAKTINELEEIRKKKQK